MIHRKRLFCDIETSPDVVLTWKTGYKINIGYENILVERAIICICYKWEGEKKIHSLTWDARQSDKTMLKEFINVMNEADEIVAHNGDRYDISFIRGRALYHGLTMRPKYQTIDTLKVARAKFNLNSNRLDYIAQYLGVGRKKETKFSLWKEILINKCPKSLAYMVKYCKSDVDILEKVFEKLSPHIEPKLNYAALYESDLNGCPECGSDNLRANGTRATLTGVIKREFRCKDCGKYHSRTIKRGQKPIKA